MPNIFGKACFICAIGEHYAQMQVSFSQVVKALRDATDCDFAAAWGISKKLELFGPSWFADDIILRSILMYLAL